MHMADALLAPSVATVMYGASTVAAGLSIYKIRKEEKSSVKEYSKLPVMAVMAALVFSAQMINYTIPGTGSSGHICGGFLLSALLGPWAGFLSMIVVLAIQGLFFADGGLMALGANVWNMAFYGCFVGYFLIWKPIMGTKLNNRVKVILASIIGCIVTLQLGAFSVVVETSLSGITELPFGKFCGLMQPIHLAIGLVEGLITSAILVFVNEARPEILSGVKANAQAKQKLSFKTTIIVLAVIAVITGGIFSLFASGNPDGLEWSLFGNAEEGYSANMGLDEEDYGNQSAAADKAAAIQEKLSILPDYAFSSNPDNAAGTSVSGVVGAAGVAAIAALVCIAGGAARKSAKKKED
ncbi:MAG: energy-coupling factor ABC transporter permease [Clostridia bacterium]|nr:energy-coupling factor ABC transporter permease [Clostridia bacterium]